jgi:hypothetical protein
MEPVGLAVGILGLVGLFNTCLDLLDKFDSVAEVMVQLMVQLGY